MSEDAPRLPPSWASRASPAMPQDEARRLVAAGGTLLLRGVPRGTEFGLDCMAWTVGERFEGVKMVPPQGAHLVRWTPAGEGAQAAPGGSLFCFVGAGEALVRRWDAGADALAAVADADERDRLAAGARRGDFDRGLAPYPLDTLARWRGLSDRITEAAVARISRGAPSMAFAEVPAVEVPDGASPAEVTALHRDRTACLERMVAGALGGDEGEVLAEFQAAFAAFFLAHSYEGFEQWKALLALLCSCEAAVARRQPLYAGLASALAAQLEEVPPDFFRDPLAGDGSNFLLRCAGDLFEIVAETPEAGDALVSAVRALAAVLRRRFDWHSPSFYLGGGTAEAILRRARDDDEYAPVIANLDELQLGSGSESD